jgi:predicted RND superfamily exporter protein
MNKKIRIIICVVIIAVIAIGIYFAMKGFNDKNPEKVKSSIETKREQLISKVEEISKERGIHVYINNGTSEEEIENLIDRISKIDGVASVTLENKEEALEELREKFGDNKELLDAYKGENNIFPDSLIVTITDFSKADKIKDIISEYENVENVSSGFKTLQAIKKNIDSYTEDEIDEFIKIIDQLEE